MNWKIFSLTVIISSVIGTGLLFLFYGQHKVLGVVSPLSDDYQESVEQYRFIFDRSTTQNYPPNKYFPLYLQPKFTQTLDINAAAFAVMDRQNGELLLSKNLTKELPIASITKIMTALVALENGSLQTELKVSSAAASIGEAHMGLTSGEVLTVHELLYGLMLPSGNDAAEALAEGLGGRTAFIISMNEKAKSLGLFDTYFFNPSGLDGETKETSSFSTCLDLLGLTNYALENQEFAQIVSTYYKDIPYKPGKHKAFFFYNILQLDRSYPGIKGVKPGNTDFAGETLVSYAENGGKQIIVVLLGATNSRDEVIKIYDYIFSKLGVIVNKA